MAKKKPDVGMHSHGRYTGWNRDGKDLPELVKITSEVHAEPGVEFGYVLRIRHARNSKISFCIEHPPFEDGEGNPVPPFEGELYVKTNDYRFFLGDTVWLPVEDKRGEWRLITWLDGCKVADKTITLV